MGEEVVVGVRRGGEAGGVPCNLCRSKPTMRRISGRISSGFLEGIGTNPSARNPQAHFFVLGTAFSPAWCCPPWLSEY
jgi:hypothetical protein